jgi:hypothetical protein
MKLNSRVNRLVFLSFRLACAVEKRQKGSEGCRGCPPGSITESIEARNLTKTTKESKSLAAPAPTVAIAFPSEGRI